MRARPCLPSPRVAQGLSALLSLSVSALSLGSGLATPPIDADSPWSAGPQTLFTQPALTRPVSGSFALSYDLYTELMGQGQALGAQQLAMGYTLGDRLTLAVGLSSEQGLTPLGSASSEGESPSVGYRALSLGQSLELTRGLSFGVGLSRRWYLDNQALNGWRLQLGLSYEPTRWLKLNVNSPTLSLERALDEGRWIAEGSAQRLSVGLRPLERLALGAGFSPVQGGGSWSASARLRLWRGLALEGRYLGVTGSVARFTRPVTLALAWGGDWGWRAELAPQAGGVQQSALASLRWGSRPQPQQLDQPAQRLELIAHKGEDELTRRGALLGRPRVSAPLLKTLRALRRTRDDQGVRRVALLLNSTGLGWAQAEELAEELKGLRAVGKEVTVFLPSVDPTAYLVAAEASEVWLRPTSEVRLSGLLTERFYLKGLLELLQIDAEMIAVGDYKSAPEMFLREGPSDEARVAQKAVLDGRYQRLLTALARRCQAHQAGCQGEKADAQALAWLREGPYNAREAKEAGLVDRVVHAVDLDRALSAAYPTLTLNAASPLPVKERGWGTPDTLAVLYLVGDIGAGSALGGGGVSAAQLVPLIHRLERRDEVKGVLLRVDSPGGAISDADEMWKSLKRLATKKPLVVSMGDIAASGGYYVAAPARLIFASPNTITGSIGVFAGKANLSPALERFGVTVHRDRRGEGGGESSLFTPWTEAQRARIKRSMEGLYTLFLERVEDGRPQLSRDALLPLAGGRVWTGAQAQARGLVDELGGQLDALTALSRLTHLGGDYQLEVVAPAPPSVLDQLGSLISSATMSTRAPASPFTHHPLASQLPTSFKGLIRLLIERPLEGLAYLPYW